MSTELLAKAPRHHRLEFDPAGDDDQRDQRLDSVHEGHQVTVLIHHVPGRDLTH